MLGADETKRQKKMEAYPYIVISKLFKELCLNFQNIVSSVTSPTSKIIILPENIHIAVNKAYSVLSVMFSASEWQNKKTSFQYSALPPAAIMLSIEHGTPLASTMVFEERS